MRFVQTVRLITFLCILNTSALKLSDSQNFLRQSDEKKGKAEHGNELENFKATLEMLLPYRRKKTISGEEKRKGIQDLS